MSEAATGTVPATNGVQPPPADPEVAKYEALRKELEPEQQSQQEPEPQPQAQEPEPKAKPPYEDLERNYTNVQEALRQERAAKKASEEQLARFMRIVEESRAKREPEPKKEEPKLPDALEDPIGHFNGRIAQLEAQLQEAHQGVKRTTEEQQTYQQQQALYARVVQSEQEIRDPKSQSHKADYDAACEYLEGTRIKQLNRMYPDDSPQAQHYARQMGFQDASQLKLAVLNQDRQAVAMQALQLGVSPAQFYYQLAEDAGYQPKPAQPRAENGQFKANEAIEAAKRGQKAAVSISGSNSGRKGAEDMAISDLAALFTEDPEAADKIWDQMAKAGKLG